MENCTHTPKVVGYIFVPKKLMLNLDKFAEVLSGKRVEMKTKRGVTIIYKLKNNIIYGRYKRTGRK